MRQYTITKVTGTPDWNKIPSLDVDNYLWCEKLDIRMKSQICYDETGLHVHLRAWEKDIRAELTAPMSMVCEASCMEFFFRPVGTGIGKLSSGAPERRVRFAAPDLIAVSGIAEGDALRLVTVDGRTAAATIDRAAGIANISLAGLPTGVYILKINQTNTIKIFKK